MLKDFSELLAFNQTQLLVNLMGIPPRNNLANAGVFCNAFPKLSYHQLQHLAVIIRTVYWCRLVLITQDSSVSGSCFVYPAHRWSFGAQLLLCICGILLRPVALGFYINSRFVLVVTLC